jgi:hypothetical protein
MCNHKGSTWAPKTRAGDWWATTSKRCKIHCTNFLTAAIPLYFNFWCMNCRCLLALLECMYMENRFPNSHAKEKAFSAQFLPSFPLQIFNFYIPYKKSQDSAVGIATGYELDGRGVGVRVPVRSRIFSSPRRPDRLWCPPSLLSNEYWGFFPWG